MLILTLAGGPVLLFVLAAKGLLWPVLVGELLVAVLLIALGIWRSRRRPPHAPRPPGATWPVESQEYAEKVA